LLDNSVSWSRKKLGSDDRIEVLQILEELALRSAERRQAHTCSKVISACNELSSLFASSGERDIEIIKKNPSHPVRELPRLLGRIGELCSDFNIEDVIPQIAWVYGHLTKEFDRAGLAEMLDVELSGGIRGINEACVRNKQEWTIYNLWANLSYVMKDWIKTGITERSRILLYTIDSLEDSVSDSIKAEMYNATYRMIETIECVVLSCNEFGYPKQTKHGKQIIKLDLKTRLLELLRRIEQQSESTGFLNFTGKYATRKVFDVVSSTKQLLSKGK